MSTAARLRAFIRRHSSSFAPSCSTFMYSPSSGRTVFQGQHDRAITYVNWTAFRFSSRLLQTVGDLTLKLCVNRDPNPRLTKLEEFLFQFGIRSLLGVRFASSGLLPCILCTFSHDTPTTGLERIANRR